MEQIRVNLTLDKAVWEKFGNLVPNRKKSKIVNELLKQKLEEMIQQKEQKELALAFQEAAKDKNRLVTISEWEYLDLEGWD